jgi:HSP20 family protein
MNALSLFNPTFAPDVFDLFERNYGTTVPSVDVHETKDAYVMEMDLPGKSEKDVEISLKDRVLSISSIQEAQKDEKKKDAEGREYLIRERRSASFARRFTLPEDIDGANVEATFANGVLTINIPRKPENQARQILIKSA